MDITRTCYGLWNGGRFMNYGEALPDERLIPLIQSAYDKGIRTFMTADVYGCGQADELVGRALAGIPRETYALVGMIGHDFYTGQRDGSKGFPRFSNPALRSAAGYADYLKMATEKSLERCKTDHFDAVLLHNPDRIGYTGDTVWKAMESLKTTGLSHRLGVAPGPANGFPLDLILNFERFSELVDWAMIILNPFEPWPGEMILGAAEKHGVKIVARVVDYGGIFHDDVRPGHVFARQDHRSFRPAGWVESAQEKVAKIRPLADRHGLTLLQLACAWTLSQKAVVSVVPTLTQEIGDGAKPISEKLAELATLPDVRLTADECAFIREIGDNTGCMKLKGANPAHEGPDLADNWPLSEETLGAASRWNIDAGRALAYTH